MRLPFWFPHCRLVYTGGSYDPSNLCTFKIIFIVTCDVACDAFLNWFSFVRLQRRKSGLQDFLNGGFRYVFPLEIIFIFITQKGGSRTPGTLPWLHPWQGEKTQCFTWYRYHSRCSKMKKKACKKMDAFACYFCQWKVNILYILWSDNKRLKKVVILFLTTSKRYYVVRVHTFP